MQVKQCFNMNSTTGICLQAYETPNVFRQVKIMSCVCRDILCRAHDIIRCAHKIIYREHRITCCAHDINLTEKNLHVLNIRLCRLQKKIHLRSFDSPVILKILNLLDGCKYKIHNMTSCQYKIHNMTSCHICIVNFVFTHTQ